MQGAVKPLTVSYSYNGRGDVDSGTITAGQSLNLSFNEALILLPITFKCGCRCKQLGFFLDYWCKLWYNGYTNGRLEVFIWNVQLPIR